jgi:hypothetical protein
VLFALPDLCHEQMHNAQVEKSLLGGGGQFSQKENLDWLACYNRTHLTFLMLVYLCHACLRIRACFFGL